MNPGSHVSNSDAVLDRRRSYFIRITFPFPFLQEPNKSSIDACSTSLLLFWHIKPPIYAQKKLLNSQLLGTTP